MCPGTSAARFALDGRLSFVRAGVPSHVYTNLLVTKKPMDFYFRPTAKALPNNTLRVAPDLLPAGRRDHWPGVDQRPRNNGLRFAEPDHKASVDWRALKVRARLVPVNVAFTADLLDVTAGVATISLAGDLTVESLGELKEELDAAAKQGVRSLILQAEDLTSISPEGLRLLAFTKQRLGEEFEITIVGASPDVREDITESGLSDEINVAELATV